MEQTWIVHLIRHCLGVVLWKDRKHMVSALQKIYQAMDADEGFANVNTIKTDDWEAIPHHHAGLVPVLDKVM
jgi:transposase-like protein